MNDRSHPVQGAGLGLRRTFLAAAAEQPPPKVSFSEVAPENWIGVGGRWGRLLRSMSEHHPFVCHGLSLSIGAPAPLDIGCVERIKTFLDQHQIRACTEHLSDCSDDGHLYDLMPIPFTGEAVQSVAARVPRVQEVLERRIALENVSYYAAPGQEMREIDFINAVLEEAAHTCCRSCPSAWGASPSASWPGIAAWRSVSTAAVAPSTSGVLSSTMAPGSTRVPSSAPSARRQAR